MMEKELRYPKMEDEDWWKLDWKIKKVQAKLDYLEELQKPFE